MLTAAKHLVDPSLCAEIVKMPMRNAETISKTSSKEKDVDKLSSKVEEVKEELVIEQSAEVAARHKAKLEQAAEVEEVGEAPATGTAALSAEDQMKEWDPSSGMIKEVDHPVRASPMDSPRPLPSPALRFSLLVSF